MTFICVHNSVAPEITIFTFNKQEKTSLVPNTLKFHLTIFVPVCKKLTSSGLNHEVVIKSFRARGTQTQAAEDDCPDKLLI